MKTSTKQQPTKILQYSINIKFLNRAIVAVAIVKKKYKVKGGEEEAIV